MIRSCAHEHLLMFALRLSYTIRCLKGHLLCYHITITVLAIYPDYWKYPVEEHLYLTWMFLSIICFFYV